ncbi:MAG: hypothetical protein J6B94_08815, partial [Lachnospiraceae bacterium]|nr:hypothetical protein [Lachnospiraceae bacterium]
KNFIMSARLIRLVYLRLASALQLCPKWTCNNVQKYFAILSKKGLQKTIYHSVMNKMLKQEDLSL